MIFILMSGISFLMGLPDLWVFQVQELITEASKNAKDGSEPVMPLIRIRVRDLRTPLCLVNFVFGTWLPTSD